jgi:SAM-dependent methyltransferase
MSDLAATHDRASYCADHFAPLFAAEDDHFWFRSRNRCIAAATRLIPDPKSIKDIIEHGCGTGFVLAELQRLFPHARVVGTDLFAEGLSFARRRFAGELIQSDFTHYNERDAFDLIGLFDVLEHLDDDRKALQALRQQLRSGGCLLLTVPAHMALWSDYDIASGHRRRYTRPQLMATLSEQGFEVRYCTEFMCLIFPIMWLRRRMSWGWRVQKPATTSTQMKNELHVPRLLNRILEMLLRPEGWWIERRYRLPVGTSLLALAIRK